MGSAPIVIVNGSTVVVHNADGTKTTSVAASMTTTDTAIGGPANISSSLAQTRIPRGPKVEVSGSWQQSIAYVEQGGAWVPALVYVEDGGVWKLAA